MDKKRSGHCAFCLKFFDAIKLCSLCSKRAYCSVECQKLDWKICGKGQGHKTWCHLGCLEEDIDWEVSQIPGIGMGLRALKDIPRLSRIIVDRAYTIEEARDRPQVMDLYPEGGSFTDKILMNSLSSDDGSVVCLRISRANHNCVANAAHWYDPNYKVKILFAERDIKVGEEITISYMSHRSLQYNYTKEMIRKTLKLKWDITCPSDCPCKDDEVWQKVSRAKILEARIADQFPLKLRDCIADMDELMKLYNDLKIGSLGRAKMSEEYYQICITTMSRVKRAVSALEEALKIRQCVEPFMTHQQIIDKIKHPAKHENYLFLDKQAKNF